MMPYPISPIGASHRGSGISAREQSVIAMFEAGMSKDALHRAMPESASLIRRSLGYIGDNSHLRDDATRSASDKLCAAVLRAANYATRHASRPSAAPRNRPMCLAPLPPRAAAADQRPIAAGREPCPKCAVRGDVGCAHQRPDPALAPAEPVNLRGERRG